MKKTLLIVLLSLSLILSACVDTSQPWKDDSDHWHTHRVCQEVISTNYIQIPVGEDKYGNTRYVNVPHQTVTTQCTYE